MLDFIPMTHTVSIAKASDELDRWGEVVVSDEVITLSANIKYNTKLSTISLSKGDEVVYTATINFTGNVAVGFDDLLTWADSRGRVLSKKPIDIFDRHDLSGNIIGVRVVV